MSLEDTIAKALSDARHARGFSQEKLASKSGISTRYYQSLEAGDYVPTLPTIFKISRALNQNYAVLIDPVWQYWQEHPDE